MSKTLNSLVMLLLVLANQPAAINRAMHHVHRKRMSIDLHRPLSIIKLDSSLFDDRLDLLSENLALIGMVRSCVMPLAVLSLLQLFSQW